MSKNNIRFRRKLNWKFYTLIITLMGLIAAMIIALYYYGLNSWLLTILFPVILSAAVSMGVSLWFTMKTEKDRFIEKLQTEIDNVLYQTIRISRVLVEVSLNPLYTGSAKKQILLSELVYKPDMYRIKNNYRDLWDLYFQNNEKLSVEIDSWRSDTDGNKFAEQFKKRTPELFVLIHEISNKAFKVQEQFYQDYKGAPKRPIPDQLIFDVGKENQSDAR